MKFTSYTFLNSLKYRLLSLLIFSLAVLIGFTAYSTYRISVHEMEEILDGHMMINGRALFSLIVVELQENHHDKVPVILDNYVRFSAGERGRDPLSSFYEAYDSEFYLQLVNPAGSTVFTSNGSTLVNTDNSDVGLFQVVADDATWHVFGLKDSNSGYSFFTAQSENVRKEFSREAIKYMLMPLIIGTIVIVVTVWCAIELGLKPLKLLGDKLDTRDVRSLKPIEQTHAMVELEPVVNSLNRLFKRMSNMLGNEQQFSADVSHELRTPLARIMANTDALNTMTTDSNQLSLIKNITLSTDNAKALTENLLLLSKLGNDNAKNYFENENINVLQVIKMEMENAQIESSCIDNPFQLSVVGNPNPVLQGSSSLFSILIKNLLDNALKHGGKTTPVEITLTSGKALEVTIRDYGSGVSNDSLEKLFDRFYRENYRENNNNRISTGLGLAIARSIANYFSATISARNAEPNGLSISLVFPLNSVS